MPYMLVRHKVADFSVWKRVFDSHLPAQQDAGLRVEKILRNMDDPNEVFLLFEVTDLEKAQAFVSSPKAVEGKEQSGVVDDPDMYLLT
jgi:hypothetical protein